LGRVNGGIMCLRVVQATRSVFTYLGL